MANGDVLYATPGRLVIKLLDAQDVSVASNGSWEDCREYVTGSITVTFSGGATAAIIEIDGLNTDVPPATATNTVKINATAAVTDSIFQIASLPNWIKARVQTTGTGTATALLCARAYPV